jgi:DNA-binding transcriptional ArsR family regulator
VWTPGQGVRHFWICGATNSGKSGAVDCLLANLMSAGIAVLDVTDLKGGASIPHWKARARTFGSSYEAAVATVRRADLLSAYRYDLMARLPAVDPDTGEPEVIDGEVQYGRTFVDPSPAWPIYVALIEEEPQIAGHPTLGPIFLAYAARIAALGRQACVILVFTSQGVTLDDVFGTNRAFRTNVQAGNVLVLWTDQGSANLALANRTLDLSVIPHGQAGVSLLAGPAQPREMPGRIPHVRRHFDAVRAARPGHLNAAEEAILDLADLLSAGADLADVRGLALGLAGDLADLDPDWAGAIGRILGEDAAAPPTADGPPGEGYTMPARTYGDAALPPAASGLPAQQQAILDVLDAYGVASTADLRKHLGKVTDQALRNHLDPLLEKEIVERAGRGRYRRATPTDSAESSAPEPIGATP